MKKSRLILCLLIILLLSVIGVLFVRRSGTKQMDARETLLSQRYIIHAGGFIECNGEEMSYTNTYETLDNLYSAGNRVADMISSPRLTDV